MWQLALYHLYFLLFVCVVCTHCTQNSLFYYTKAILIRHEHQNNAPTIAVGHHHTGALNNTLRLNTITNYKSYIIAHTYSQHMFETVLHWFQHNATKSNKKKQEGFKHNDKINTTITEHLAKVFTVKPIINIETNRRWWWDK